LPESILGNPSYEHVVGHLLDTVTLLGVVTMPESLFKTSGKGGTHTKVCVLLIEKKKAKGSYPIFMAEAKWCGHDSRGNPTVRRLPSGEEVVLDDLPTIHERFEAIRDGKAIPLDHLGFVLSSNGIKNGILVPKYYNPEIDAELRRLESTHNVVSFGSLLKREVLSVETGVEIGKMAYGTGRIPFIRTSDISNWEIKADFKHGVSPEIYESYKTRVDVQAGDILMVRDGTYLIGTTAIVTESDVPMLFQSHIYRIRADKPDVLSPWLLLACLNSPIVRRQIRAKQFTQDIIDTLGKRLYEILLPIPKASEFRKQIADETRRVIETRVQLRNRAKEIALAVEGITYPEASDLDDDSMIAGEKPADYAPPRKAKRGQG
jgi:type I restriction enzyme M protein